MGVHLFAKPVRHVEQIGTFLHAFVTVEDGQLVNPLAQLREPGVVKAVFSSILQMLQVAVRNAVAVFCKDVHGPREELFSGKVFVDDYAETEVVYGLRQVFSHDGLFRRAVAGGQLAAVFRNGFTQLCLGVAEIAHENLVVVLVLGILAQQQVLWLQVFVDHLVVMQLADGVGQVRQLGHPVQNLVVAQVRFEGLVHGATLDEFHLQVRVPSGDAAAHALYHAFDVGSMNQVVDSNFILEGAQQHVQAVNAVLAGRGPVLANLDDDFLFRVTGGFTGLLQPMLGSVQVVGALQGQGLDEFDALGGAIVQELRILVEPPLVFFHGVVGA